ncbi:hypothetical protein FKW77_003522 [Venturia effusa]|uniref:MHYT domain-containing protein n=1 Tax=Venturia effusa TaxID=50376 RepID=A0A517LL65_9PEZI|nr:hypothetical protein FKW77_003522 [Venturia effusa]
MASTNATSTRDDWYGYSKGMEVPFHFQSGVIIASYFVSLVGSITTVELLHRKREGTGWTIWAQQLAIAVSFGLVAIWCMHFVGNRAIVLGDGQRELQLYYNPGFTTVSVFLPIVFLFLGFTTVEFRQPGQPFFWPSLGFVGIVAGLAITGMHYVGNFGINNYNLENPPQYVVGAGLIAVCACCIALALFFYFKGRWINSFPRRMACACLLAGAVSGMHWTASVGTRYRLGEIHDDRSGMSRDTNLIVAIVLSLLACVVCFAFGILTQRRKKQLADRAQHVMLASVTFDPDGKLLVTQEGILPAAKVTKQYNQRSFNDEFNIAHPVFQWLFRVTFNWPGVADLVPGMRSHLRTIGATSNDPTRSMTPTTESAFADETNSNEDYSIIFREHFCVAAAELASHLETSLQEIGVLYNGIMMTGSLNPEFQVKKSLRFPSRGGLPQDLESGIALPTMFGSGQLLFLVRVVDKPAALKLMTAGYRFAQPIHVGDIIARSMQVPHHEMLSTISSLQAYSKQNLLPLEEPGYSTYLACYAMRAAVNKANSSWEVLVAQENPFQLPQVELTQDPLKPWQSKILQRLDGLSANQCLSWLNNKASECTISDDKEFLEHLLDQVTALTIGVPEPFFGQAIFSSKAVRLQGNNNGMPINLYAFCIIPDVHASSLKSKNKLTYVPLSFFKCFQRIYKGSPDHAILTRKIHREFGAILNAKGVQASDFSPTSTKRDSTASSMRNSMTRPKRLQWPFVKSSGSTSTRRSSILKPDFASDKGLTEDSQAIGTAQPFGGIMVSSDTTVVISAKQESTLELQEMGLKSEAGVGATEQPTYVDELFQIASQKWRQH